VMGDDELTDGFTDEQIWQMDLTATSSSVIICRKAVLIAEAAAYLQPRVRNMRRRLTRTSNRIKRYLGEEAV